MIETLVNSKTRIKVLKLFLSHIDDRYYLRELERLLEESLSPLRRQLIKLTNMGILVTEEEANLKYYKLNKNFEGLEELRELVLESRKHAETGLRPDAELTRKEEQGIVAPKRFRYDLALLSFISVFVLATAMFVVYANSKNIRQVTKLISQETVLDSASARYSPDRSNSISNSDNGEMVSKKWKIMPSNVPVLSSGETGEDKNSKEL